MPDYIALAREAIIDLLEREHACVWPEIEAKLGEAPFVARDGTTLKLGINPNHLQTARTQLIRRRQIEEISATTRGGHPVSVLALRNRHRQKVVFERAARRKRLLHGRYQAWAARSPKHPNLIGDGGERVTHASLKEAAAAGVGYHLINPTSGQVSQLFGSPVPGGPLDNGAFLTALTHGGLPIAVTVPVEVKNVRHWLWPKDDELWQLLDKAARLQLQHPDQRFVPVLVCRRAHRTTFNMAKDLGFVVADMRSQPILPHSAAPQRAVNEINNELGYGLIRSEDPHPLVTNIFREAIPRIAVRSSERWAIVAPSINGDRHA